VGKREIGERAMTSIRHEKGEAEIGFGCLLLNIEQVCRVLNLGRTKIYELIESGDLERVKVGRATRVTSSSVQALPGRLKGDAP
jgi:excisionase family DNA binding protein